CDLLRIEVGTASRARQASLPHHAKPSTYLFRAQRDGPRPELEPRNCCSELRWGRWVKASIAPRGSRRWGVGALTGGKPHAGHGRLEIAVRPERIPARVDPNADEQVLAAAA